MKPKDPLRASPNPSIQAPESALHPARELALKHHGVFHSDALSMPSLCFMSQTCSTITRSKRIFLFKDEILSAGTTLEPEASVWVSGIANSYQSGENWRHSTVLLLTQRLWSQILAQTWDHLGKKKKSTSVPLMKYQADTWILMEINIICSIQGRVKTTLSIHSTSERKI